VSPIITNALGGKEAIREHKKGGNRERTPNIGKSGGEAGAVQKKEPFSLAEAGASGKAKTGERTPKKGGGDETRRAVKNRKRHV